MKQLILICAALSFITACTEEERPAAQAKHALDAAHQAANQATQHAQDMADKAERIFDDAKDATE
ncbi:MAG: hypothetical protein Q9N02_11350 [Ghiorsea sp.]|nr:hypothetical protein [Ghiorsea sp.]